MKNVLFSVSWFALHEAIVHVVEHLEVYIIVMEEEC